MVENFQKVVLPAEHKRESARERYNYNDEIDLRELAVKVFTLISRYKLLFAIGACVGGIGGFIGLVSIQPLYKSELVISIPDLERHEFQRLLFSFQENIRHDRSAKISDHLKEMDVVDFPSSQRNSFIISASVSDKAIYPQLRGALIRHLDANPFLKQEKELRVNKVSETILLLNSEEAKVSTALDRTFTSGQFFDADFGVADLAKLKLDMQKERIALKNELQKLQAITVIQDFVTPSRPYNKNVFKIFGITIGISLCLCLFMIFVLEVRRFVRQANSKTVPFLN